MLVVRRNYLLRECARKCAWRTWCQDIAMRPDEYLYPLAVFLTSQPSPLENACGRVRRVEGSVVRQTGMRSTHLVKLLPQDCSLCSPHSEKRPESLCCR